MNLFILKRYDLHASLTIIAMVTFFLTLSPRPIALGFAPNFGVLDDSPYVLKRTVQITPRRYLRWWQNPNAAEPVYNTWSWAPEVKIGVHGPIAAGSNITVEFDTADGKPWFTQRMRTPELDSDRWDIVSEREDISLEQLEKKAVTAQAGVFPFRVRLKNALNGTDTVIFAGKYRIATYAPDQKILEYRGKKEFYVDEDWRLPMAWLWLNPDNGNEDAPPLCLQTWFRNSKSSDEIEAFVYYGGKQIANIKSTNAEDTLTNGVDELPYRYTMRTFNFYLVRSFNGGTTPQSYRNTFNLDKRPGDYEIKILKNGELARSLSFTVGADGKIVNNSVVTKNKIGGVRMLMPIKILGSGDGSWNKIGWQTDAFYGNPLTDFIAQ